MASVAELDRMIAEKKRQLESVEGTETEIYSRIVGYYRSLKNWNKGKREEFTERRTYRVDESLADAPDIDAPGDLHPVASAQRDEADRFDRTDIASYLFFYRDTCPNCPTMKRVLADLTIDGVAMNVDAEEGFEAAKAHEILSTPHVVFFTEEGRELWRSGDPVAVRDAFDPEEMAG